MRSLRRVYRKIVEPRAVAAYVFCLAYIVICCAPKCWCQADPLFTEVIIEPAFIALIRSNAAFMAEGGARLIESEDGCTAIIGISRVHLPEGKFEPPQKMVRKGAIKARAAIVEHIFGVEIETRSSTTTSHLDYTGSQDPSSTFQTLKKTQSISKADIDFLPVIGTWQSKDGNIFFAAVGKLIKSCEKTFVLKDFRTNDAFKDAKILETKEPFLSLLKTSPLLCKYGGAQGYEIDGRRKVVMAVGYATIKGSIVKARKIAKLMAVRALLSQNEGIRVIQVQSMQDQEKLHLINGREQHLQLSDFWSMQKEHTAGKIKSLPEVLVWQDRNKNCFFVAIGTES
jgi:hypothetical protein